jgi:hypothetical protein
MDSVGLYSIVSNTVEGIVRKYNIVRLRLYYSASDFVNGVHLFGHIEAENIKFFPK